MVTIVVEPSDKEPKTFAQLEVGEAFEYDSCNGKSYAIKSSSDSKSPHNILLANGGKLSPGWSMAETSIRRIEATLTLKP